MNGHFPHCRCTRCCNKCCTCTDKAACKRKRIIYLIVAIALFFTILFAAKYFQLLLHSHKKAVMCSTPVLVEPSSRLSDDRADSAISASSKKYRIAILRPMGHPALDEIQQAFIDYIKKIHPMATFDLYDGNGDRMIMQSQTEKVFSDSYDLICAIATSSALLCKEVANKKNAQIPLILCAADETILAPLIKKNDLCVVINDKDNLSLQLDLLLFLKKTNHIILPYGPSPSIDCMIDRFEALCKKHAIVVTKIAIFSPNELFTHVSSALHDENDVIFVFKDNIIVSAIESLVALAQRKNITLYVSDLRSCFQKLK